MTREQIRKAVIDIIVLVADNEEIDVSQINDDKGIRDQAGLDSMDFLDIIMELRKRYGVDVPEKDYMELSTMNGCVNYLEPKLKDK